jgi:putative SOS response-associated peptidase YedK
LPTPDARLVSRAMCNLYNISTNQEALRALVSSFDDLLGNLEPSIDVWPDRMAPIIRNGLSEGARLSGRDGACRRRPSR